MSQIQIKQVRGLEELLNSRGSIKTTFIQQNHNFSPGNVVSYYQNNWVLAQFNEINGDRLARIVVESIVDPNSFVGVLEGFIQVASWNLISGGIYYLSSIPGQITSDGSEIEPYSNPIIQAITSNTAHVLPYRPSKRNSIEDFDFSEFLEIIKEITQEEVPLTTNGDFQNTGISLNSKTANNSTIQIYVNTVSIRESYGNRSGECYFSSDGGLTAKNIDEIQAGDFLYWNGNIAGYNLDQMDIVSMVYHSDNINCSFEATFTMVDLQ